MAAKKKASKKSGGGNREVLVVGSKVKEYVRGKQLMASGDLLPAISERVYEMLDRAAERVEANKRSTMRPQDL